MAHGPLQNARVDSGSFRDRSSRVFYDGGRVLRVLDERAAKNWERLSQTQFFTDFSQRESLIATQRVDQWPETLPAGGAWRVVLSHKRVPFISYPYEWTFGMLKDAALLQLDLLSSALEEGLILQDASAYNVQWMGTRSVFIDIPSFKELTPGEPWIGYRQFCMFFLYPLMLQAYRGTPFHPWLRGHIDGIEPEVMATMMGPCDVWRRGVMTHILLHAWLEKRRTWQELDTRVSLRQAGFNIKLIAANVARLRKLVSRLRSKRIESTWSSYEETHGYALADHQLKKDFVCRAAQRRRWSLVWDLGGNTGEYSRIAAEFADSVVLMDADHITVDRVYESLRREGSTRVLPLVVDLADPSPGRGWRGAERKTLEQRGRPDLVLALALVHHLVIGACIRLPDFVQWLIDLGAAVVIEFVTREDEMVQQLLRNRDDQFVDYDESLFESLLAPRFEVLERMPLKNGRRVLYSLEPRSLAT